MDASDAPLTLALEVFCDEQEYRGNRPAALLFYRKSLGASWPTPPSPTCLSSRRRGWLLELRGLRPNMLAACA